MSKNAASEELLGELHTKITKVMIKSLEQVEKAQDTYDDTPDDEKELVRPEVSASLLSAMTKFLADNKITCNPAEGSKMSELEQRLRRKKQAVGNVVPFKDD